MPFCKSLYSKASAVMRSEPFNILLTVFSDINYPGPSGNSTLVHTYFCQHLLPFCCLWGVWMSLNQVEELLSQLLELLLLLLHVIFKGLKEGNKL